MPKLTFINYRIATESGDRIRIEADCVETGKVAFADMHKCGRGDPMDRAAAKFARLEQ